MTPPTPPFDPSVTPEEGDWSRWAYFVLAELRRLNEGNQTTHDNVQEILSQMRLDRQAVENMRRDFDREISDRKKAHDELAKIVRDNKTDADKRLDKLEQNDLVATAFSKGKIWVVSLAFIILTAILLPTISLLWKG